MVTAMRMFACVVALIVASTVSVYAEDHVPQMQCDSEGNEFVCAVTECEGLKHYPEWTLRNASQADVTAAGLAFAYKTPKEGWSTLTCLITDDKGHKLEMRAVLRLYKGVTQFAIPQSSNDSPPQSTEH